jgi:hypothetical protein
MIPDSGFISIPGVYIKMAKRKMAKTSRLVEPILPFRLFRLPVLCLQFCLIGTTPGATTTPWHGPTSQGRHPPKNV